MKKLVKVTDNNGDVAYINPQYVTKLFLIDGVTFVHFNYPISDADNWGFRKSAFIGVTDNIDELAVKINEAL
jgi:hypothetical protein